MKQILLFLFLSCGCKLVLCQTKTLKAEPTFNLTTPAKKWILPPELDEISGATWIDNDHLLVIEDIHPFLYLIKLVNDKAVIEKKIVFKTRKTDKKFDIEDICLVGSTAYAVWSHGKIFKITNWNANLQVKEIPTFLSKDNNTEGACYDPATNSLLIACKNNSGEADEKKSVRAIYRFDLKTDSLLHEPFMLIHKKDFKEKAGEKINFFPSAIAIHPQTGDIYILSTKDTKCLAVFTHAGQLKSFQLIHVPGLDQPEGICFSPTGALYITTETKHGQPAAVFMF